MSAFDLSLPLKIKLDDRSVFLRKTIIEALESGKEPPRFSYVNT